MEWNRQDDQISLPSKFLHIFVILQAKKSHELLIRLLGELQVMIVLVQLCVNQNLSVETSEYSAFDFIDFDAWVLENARAISSVVLVSLALSYLIIVVGTFGRKIIGSRRGIVREMNWEYTLTLFHSILASYNINLLGFDILSNNQEIDLSLTIIWGCILILNNTVGIIGARFYNIRLRGMGSCAAKSYNHSFEGWIYKLLDIIIRNFLQDKTKDYFRLALALIFIIKRSKTLLNNEFYDFRIQKKFWVAHGLEISLFIGGIIKIFGELSTNLTLFLVVIIGILLSFSFYSMQKNFLISWTSKPLSKCSSESDFETKLNVIEYLFESGSGIEFGNRAKTQQLLFKTLLDQNLNIKETKFFDYQSIVGKLAINLKTEIYKAYLVKHPHSAFLRLSYCNFQIQSSKELSSTIILEMIDLARSKSNRETSILAKKILNKIYKSLYAKIVQEEFVDINFIIDFMRYSSLFSSLIKEVTKEYHNFWSEIHSKIPAIEKFEIARKLQNYSNKLDSAWSKLKSSFPRSIHSETVIYSLYLLLVRGRPSSSFKIFQEKLMPMRNSNLKNTKRLLERCLLTSETVVLVIERNEKGKERVLHTTKSIEFLGYTRKEIETIGIEVLIPNYYRLQGSSSLIDYIEKVKGTVLGTTFKLFLKGKKHLLFPMDCFMSIVAGRNTFTYMIVMELAEETDLAIMCSPEGILEGWTEPLEEDTKLSTFYQKGSEEMTIYDFFLVKSLAQGQSIAIETNPRFQSTSRLSPLMKKSHMKASRTRNLLQSETQMDLEFIRGPFIKYLAKKISDPSISKHIILRLNRYADPDSDEELIPEERGFNTMETEFKTDVYNTMAFHDVLTHEDIKTPSRKFGLFRKKSTRLSDQHSNQTPIFVLFDRSLEESLHDLPASRSLSHINYGIIIYIILAIVLSFIYLFTSIIKIEAIPQVSQTLLSVNRRHLNLWTWIYFDAITLKLVFMNLYEDRMGYTQLAYFQSTHYFWTPLNANQHQYMNEILDRIPIFEPSLQHEFYRPIRIFRTDAPDEKKSVDLFTLDKMIMENGYRMTYLQYLPIEAQSIDDPRYLFIANNVLDDQYVVEEYFYEIIKEDISIKLAKIEEYGQMICYSLLAFAVIIFSYIVLKQKDLILSRLNLAEAMNRISSYELEDHMGKVSNFLEIFEKDNEMEMFYDRLTKEKAKKTSEKDLRKGSREAKFISSSLRNLNTKLFILIILIFTMIILILGISYLNLVLTQNNQTVLRKHISNSVKAGVYMNQMVTISTTLYAYMLSYGQVTLKNRPFQEIWDICVKDLATSQEFYLSLLEQVDPDLAEILNQHYTMDMCQIYTDGSCFPQVQPIVQRGAFGLYSFIFQASLRIKTEYDLSQKTFDDMKRILYTEDFMNQEYAMYLYPVETYFMLQILQTQVERTVERYKKAMIISVSCFVTGFILFLLFFWGPIKRSLGDQRIQIFEMMRMIPLSVLKYNISIKTFWNRFSKVLN